MANKTGDFLPLQLTNTGRDMLTQSRNGQTLTFTKIIIGDGTATATEIDGLTAIKSKKLELPISKNETVHTGQMRLQFRVSNSQVTTSFYFREIGLMAKLNNGTEKLYAYTTSGNNARMVYDRTYPIQEKIVNIDTVTDNASDIRVILDTSIIYATKKDIETYLIPHKEAAELDHPDSSVTTRKIRDKAVTMSKLADDVQSVLNTKYVRKTGDTMSGDLTLNNSNLIISSGSAAHKINVTSNKVNIGTANVTQQVILNGTTRPKWENASGGDIALVRDIDAHKTTTVLDHPDSSVTTEKLKDLAVTTPKINDKAVTMSKLADDVQTTLNTAYVRKVGDTMTGALVLDSTGKTAEPLTVKKGNVLHTISAGGGDGSNFDVGNVLNTNQTVLACRTRPVWYSRHDSNRGGKLAILSDLNDQVQTHHRTQPEIVSLMDWDRMIREGGGDRSSIFSVQVAAANDIYAHGGDNGILRGKYGENQGVIFLKEDYMNYDEILFISCSDGGWFTEYYSMKTWLFDYAMTQPMSFDITGGASFHWKLAPKVKLKYYPRCPVSTNTMLITVSQNSAILDILGIRYRRLS